MRSLVALCAMTAIAGADAKLPSDAAFDSKPGDWTHYELERELSGGMFQTHAVAIYGGSLQGFQWFSGDAALEQKWELGTIHQMLRELAKAKGTKRTPASCGIGKPCTRLVYVGKLASFGQDSKVEITATLAALRGTGIVDLEVKVDDAVSWRMKAVGYGNGTKATWGTVPWKTSVPATTNLATPAYVTPTDVAQAFIDLRPDTGPLFGLSTTGNLDKAIIRRYLKRNLQKLIYCYEKEQLAKPTLQGAVDFTFEIGGDGKVTSSTAKGLDREVENCAAGVVKGIEFPKPKEMGTVAVTFRMIYQPPRPPAAKKI